MESEAVVCRDGDELAGPEAPGETGRVRRARRRNVRGGAARARQSRSAGADAGKLPASVQATVAAKRGEYDGRRLRSQREVIRDVMLAAAGCETWLTLAELRALTRFGEASISAQLRHLRKPENGGYDVVKRHRDEGLPEHAGVDRRGECLWEYQIARAAGARVEVEEVKEANEVEEACLA